MKSQSIGFWAAALFTSLLAIPTWAQPQGGRNFDPAQFRQMMNDRIKEMLGATDEEFQVLQPKIDKIMTLQMSSRGSGMGMLFSRGGGGGGGGAGAAAFGADLNAQPSPVQASTTDLKTALDNKDTKPEEIKAKLAKLREAKEKAKAEMATAQKELRELLTQRQEAVLVMIGYLD